MRAGPAGDGAAAARSRSAGRWMAAAAHLHLHSRSSALSFSHLRARHASGGGRSGPRACAVIVRHTQRGTGAADERQREAERSIQ